MKKHRASAPGHTHTPNDNENPAEAKQGMGGGVREGMTHRRGVVRRGLLPLVPERRRLADHEERGNGRRVVLRAAPPHRAARVQRRVERVRVHWS